ncbi:hypothetical protein [Flavobacterium frigoris]|uniref:Uncharacterized protein n=1 Tax=Flavobacterium frigoris (strain PS1) TaxID=1086011 RepID=H7FPA8_FLAFP|nr:hypothetical protein [Flavobacterium frigoris]EIA09588.1 hypothetical protein HJ01_01006 [Flavobacterium frigoris PS1]
MSNLNQTQKDYLKTVANVEQSKKIKKAFKKSNRNGINLNCVQKDYLVTVQSYFARKELKKMFIDSNLDHKIKHSID